MRERDKNHDLLDYIACSVSDEADDAYRHEAALIQIEVFEAMVQNCAVAIFAIDSRHRVIHWNKACEELTGIPSAQVLGSTDQWMPFYETRRQTLSDLIVDSDLGRMTELYTQHGPSLLIPNGLHAEGWYPSVGGQRRYLIFDAAPIHHRNGELLGAVETLQDITALKEMEEEKERLNAELREALNQIKTLSGLIPICAACKKIRDDKGYWNQLENYLEEHSDAVFSHGLCPECFQEYFPEAAKPRKE
ncbi:MAG TPA: PAS domain-containing protein [Deltaproteobacteria bacterium]|mgnify:CR=1 FL=1|nr:PAS domain-containing protein [Deltaproteobacteria bacterium]HQI81280.1 PAS domain-containing protein [Deltaproteobacteria bacterium]